MARLNDTGQPPGDTLESLKRRFVRQNRELARANSNQSIRIRNLESEISRLLGEKLELKEQVIKLQKDLDKTPRPEAWKQVWELKGRLQEKLADLGGLLQEFNLVEEGPPDGCNEVKHQSTSIEQLARQRPIRPRPGIIDLLSEGRLPCIDEERRSSRSSDVLRFPGVDVNLDSDSADSPDLGPPPVAHFEETQQPKVPSASNISSLTQTPRPDERTEVSLQSRRRRRESAQRQSSNESADHAKQSKEVGLDDIKKDQGVKPTAKRKLQAREDEDRTISKEIQSGSRDGQSEAVQLPVNQRSRSRPTHVIREKRVEKSKTTSTESKIRATIPDRRVLAPKHGNTDLQSPIKRAGVAFKEQHQEGRVDVAGRKTSRSPVKENFVPYTDEKRSRKLASSDSSDSISLPPKTPLLDELELFSPTISDPSEPRPDRGDTPPPPHLDPDTGTGSLGRASRRSRGSVSYAEPSLRDKMRRPTKELVDAVAKKTQHAGSRIDDNFASLENELEKLSLKQTDVGKLHQRWPTKPVEESKSQKARQREEITSPLGNKASTALDTLPASVVTDRRRRTSSISRKDEDGREQKSSVSATAIAALSGHSHEHASHISSENIDEGDHDSMLIDHPDRHSIFDFTTSSPERAKISSIRSTKSARRHSSVPSIGDPSRGILIGTRRSREPSGETRSRGAEKELAFEPDVPNQDNQGPSSTIGRAAGRRRSMMI